MNINIQKVKTVRKIKFELMGKEYVRLKIIPDSSVKNWKTEEIMRAVSEQFRLPIDRIWSEGWKITGYRVQERASFEIVFEKGTICFYMSVPKHIAPMMKRRLSSVWDKATIEEVENHLKLDESKTAIYENIYREHALYSLRVNSDEGTPLSSVIESGRLLAENERAVLFSYFEPIHQPSWHTQLSEAWTRLREGRAPRRFEGTAKGTVKTAALGLSVVASELVQAVSSIVSSSDKNIYKKKPVDPEASKFRIQNLEKSTIDKPSKSALKTYIWAAVESEDVQRADMIARTMSLSLQELSGDNELVPRIVKQEKKKKDILRTIETKQPSQYYLPSNKMSTAEASKFVQLPSLALQEKYSEIERISVREVEVANKSLTSSGIRLGDSIFKGQKFPIYQPTKDEDELSLPHVGIGGMGQGKTRGLLANYLIEFVKAGYGGLAIDPAKRQVREEVQHALDCGYLKPEQVELIDLGKTIFSFDFCEALHDERSRARLANTIVSFFEVADETTGRTERFLRAAVMSLQSGKLIDIFNVFEDEKVLDASIKRLEEKGDKFNLSTLKEYKGATKSMRGTLVYPIYNRMNDIFADPHLFDCMNSDNSLDFVQILSNKKIYVFDVPAADLDKTAIDVIVSLISLKIDLAMRMREKITGKEFPFVVLIDEPHQFSRSTKTWEDAVVESRKWRVCYFWTFHYWEQIPSKLQKAIRSSLPHYHLYPSTSATFKSLQEELYPFEMRDFQQLKRWSAINIIRADGENSTPFIAEMLAPPTKRLKKLPK